MDLVIVITLVCLAFGAGGWFYRINNRLNKIERDLEPLIMLHKAEIISHTKAQELPTPNNPTGQRKGGRKWLTQIDISR